MIKEICLLLTLVVMVNCHMTGLCVSRVSDGRLQVAVEHWHGAEGIRAGATYTVSQGGLSVTGPWQAPLACGCPPLGCGTSYFSCGAGCNGSGVWFAIVNDPGFSYPGNIAVTAAGGGSVTDVCGACTNSGSGTTATIPLPPPASTCFADICGDGIVSGPEVCEVASPCPPGYPNSICGSCCLTGTACCNTGTALCRDTTITLDLNGQGTVSVADVDNGSTLSPDCPQAGYPQLSRTALTCADYPSTTVNLLVGPAGGSETCTATVTVNDVTPPSISCPSSTTINNDAGQCGATFSYTAPVGTDSCPGAVTTQIAGPAPGSFFGIGSTTSTYTVQDQAGLTASCSFTVTVVDAENPVIDGSLGSTGCPLPIVVNNDAGLCGATVTYTTPIGTDNCPGATTALTSGIGSGNFFPVGITTETYQVTDAVGRTSLCSFTVTVNDNEPPVMDGTNGSIGCPGDITTSTDPGLCTAAVTYTEPVAVDNCPGATTSLFSGVANGSNFPQFSTTQVYRGTDAVGNMVSCTFDVNVEDNEPPVVSHTPPGVVTAFPTEPYSYTVTMTDNCAANTLTYVSGPLATDSSTEPTNPMTVWHQASDAAGNVILYEFDVQTIGLAVGVGSPSYMYIPMEFELADGAFPLADVELSYQLRQPGSSVAAFESRREARTTSMKLEGTSQVVPGVWEFWLVGYPSTTARFAREFILCASDHFCY